MRYGDVGGRTRSARRARMLIGVLSVLGLTGGVSMFALQPAGATLGACGTEPTGAAVYIDCVVPPATAPFATYHDGDFINMSMGPNSVFSPSDSLSGGIVAIECEYTTGSVPGDPPNANFCDAQTSAGGYPLTVNSDGSFDYYVANGSAGNSSLMNTYALPGSSFAGAAITCDATHPCVWYVGENFNSFTAPHVFSNPFLMEPASTGTAPAITSGNATTFTVGSVGTFSVTTTGSPTSTISETGTLPSGVTLTDNGNGTATLAGTPATGTANSYPITITAANGVTPNATQSFTLTVHNPSVAPAITSANATTFTVGSAGTFSVTTTGTPTPAISKTAGTLPSGVTLTDNGNGTATLAGTPGAATGGAYMITLTASNGVTPNATQSFILHVNQVPAITSANATTFTVGSAGTFSVTTTGTPTPAISDTAGTLPSGVTLTDNGNGTATLAGTPATGTANSYPITITANNGVTPNATQSFTLTVNNASAAPAITSANSTTFTVGAAGTFSVTTTGSPTPAISKTAGTLPTGVTLTDNGNGTATLAGTPGAGTGGSYTFTITANNGVTPNATQSFTLHVNQAPAITSANATTFTVGSAGTFSVTTTGTPTAAISKTAGTLPTGVTLTDNGNGTATLAGTPATGTANSYPFTITANSGVTPNATQSFTLTVHNPSVAPAITSANSTTFTVGAAGTFSVTTTGSPLAAINETGTLPNGVTFVDNGNGTATLAGTPASGTANTYPFTITANNGVTPDATQSFTLTVSAASTAPAITSASSTTFTVGSAGTFSVTTTGSPSPAITKTGSLPTGVTLTDNGNGTATLAGTPASGTANTYPLNITANNGVTPNATQSFILTVANPSTGGNVMCTGSLSGTFKNVIVPPNATCTLGTGTTITSDLLVGSGGTLHTMGAVVGQDLYGEWGSTIRLGGGSVGHNLWTSRGSLLYDLGTTIGHDLGAVGVTGLGIQGGTVGHDVFISGVMGSGPTGADNFACGVTVGHDLGIFGARSSTPFVVGDTGKDCTAAATVRQDLFIVGNASPMYVRGNSIGHNLLMLANRSGGITANTNTVGHSCAQMGNSPYSGTANIGPDVSQCNGTTSGSDHGLGNGNGQGNGDGQGNRIGLGNGNTWGSGDVWGSGDD